MMKRIQYIFIMALMLTLGMGHSWAISGSGTSSNPYLIENASDLATFRDIVNGLNGQTRNSGACAMLTENITLSGSWTPIGNSGNKYSGTFDGNGKTISGLSISYTTDNQGLFGYTDGATIKDFTLSGSMSSGTNGKGAIGTVVGRASGSTTIQNVISNVSITLSSGTTQDEIGGIVGWMEGSTTIQRCIHAGSISAGASTNKIGGIVGYATSNCSGSIKYCYNSGNISTSGSSPIIGGILGYIDDNTNPRFGGVQYCFNKGALTFPTSSSNAHVNGIVGRIRGYATTTIHNRYYSTTASRACNSDGPSIPGTNGSVDQTSCTNGEAAYLLNGNSSSATAVWRQNLGSENYPTLDQSHSQVYYHSTQVKWTCNGDANHNYSNWSNGEHPHYSATVTYASGSTSAMGSVSKTITRSTTNAACQLTVTATPSSGYHFVGWHNGTSTSIASTSASYTVNLTGNTTLKAEFAPNQYTVTIVRNYDYRCTVSGTGLTTATQDNQTVYQGTYDFNSTQTFTATPANYCHFQNWKKGDATLTSNNGVLNYTLTDTSNVTLTVNCNKVNYNLTLQSNDAAMGTVSGSGLDWGNNPTYGRCDAFNDATVTATPATGYHFNGWCNGSNNCSTYESTDNPYVLRLYADKTLRGIFAINTYNVTVNSGEHGTAAITSGTANADGTYNHFTHLTLTATANTGYHFKQWNDGNTQNPRTVQVTGTASYTAQFAINTYNVTVSSGGHGTAAITETANANGTYNHFTHLTLTATPDAHYHFTQWSDGNTENPRTVQVTGAATYTAQFAIDTYTLTLGHTEGQTDSWGTFGVSGTGITNNHNGTWTVPYGTQVSLSATPASNYYHFKQWSGANPFAMPASDVSRTGEFEYVFTIENNTLTACKDWASGPYEIPASVTDIGNSAFIERGNITAITFGEGSQLATIGVRAFKWSGITSVNIPASVTSIGDWAFSVCRSLSTVTFAPRTAGQTLTLGSNSFTQCPLTSITIPASVTSIGSAAFDQCSSLGSITFAEGSQLTSIGAAAFYGCGTTDGHHLTAITIPASVTSIGLNAFKTCTYLENVTLQPTTPPQLGSDAFADCSSGLQFHLNCNQQANYTNTTTYPYASGWSSYSSLFAPDMTHLSSVSASVVNNYHNIGDVIFGQNVTNCSDPYLTAHANEGYHFVKWSTAGNDNYSTSATLTASEVAANTTYYAHFAPELYTLTVAHSNSNETWGTLGVSGDGVIDNGVNDEGYHTYTVPYRTSLTITPQPHNENGNYYKFIEWLEPGGNVDGTHTIEGTYIMPLNGATLTVQFNYVFIIVDNVLYGCEDWASGAYDIPSGVTSISNRAFKNLSNITAINFPTSVTSIGDSAFFECSSLGSITFAEGSQLATIGKNAFYSCGNLTSIAIPASVTTIGNNAFRECIKLGSITFDEGSLLTSIGISAFMYCGTDEGHHLTAITIPSGVTSIGSTAFSYCYNLQHVFMKPATPPDITEWIFDDCHTNLKIHLTCQQIDAYITNNTNIPNRNAWSSFSEKIAPDLNHLSSVQYAVASDCSGMGSVSVGQNVTTCSDTYLTATANEHYHFVKWSTADNDSYSTSATLTAQQVTGGTTYTAHFAIDTYTLTVGHASGQDNWGTISVSGSGITNNPDGTWTVPYGTELTLTPTPTSNYYHFTQWSDGNTDATRTYTMPAQNVSLTAEFEYVFTIVDNVLTACKGWASGAYEIPASVTAIGYWAFQPQLDNPSQITAITFEQGSLLTTIGEYAFCECGNLESITLPNTLTTIGDRAFETCGRNSSHPLTSITIPASVTSIGSRAFYNCSNLQHVYMQPSTPPSLTVSNDKTPFSGCPSNLQIHLSCQQMANYTNTTTYANASSWTDSRISSLLAPPDLTHLSSVQYDVAEGQSSMGSVYRNSSPSSCSTHLLTATPATGYHFVKWTDASGNELSTSNPLTAGEAAANTTYYAHFAINTYTITVAHAAGQDNSWGTVSVSANGTTLTPSGTDVNGNPTYTVPYLTALTLTANGYNNCYHWKSWSIGGYSSSTSMSVAENRTVTVEFEYVFTFQDGTDENNNATRTLTECKTWASGAYEIPSGVTAIGNNAFVDHYNITAITIPASVTAIGNSAFKGCNKLGSITFAQGSQLATIGDNAFVNCGTAEGHHLTAVTIPATVTSLGQYAFAESRYLATVTFADYTASQTLTLGSYAFRLCTSLTTINLPATLTAIPPHAFQECSQLSSITIPASVTSIGDQAFSDCSQLKDVYLLPTTPPEVGSWSFNSCHSELKFHLTCDQAVNYSTANIWSQNYSSRLAPIMNLPTGVSAQVATDCQGMGSASVNTGVDICNGAYLSATPATGYHFVKWSTATNDNFSTSATLSVDGVTDNTTYYAHFALTTYTLTVAHAAGQDNSWGTVSVSANGTTLTPSGTDVNGNPTYTVLPGTELTLTATATSNYYQWKSWSTGDRSTSIRMLVAENSTVTFEFEYVFTIVDDTDENNNATRTLTECKTWASGEYTIPTGVTAIGANAFDRHYDITAITIPASVTAIGSSAFNNCEKLGSITFSTSSQLATIGDNAFRSCGTAEGHHLTTVTIPATVTSLGQFAFAKSSYLATVTFEPRTDAQTLTMNSYTFYECYALTTINLPASLTAIPEFAFEYCTQLSSITIPAGVTSIGNVAFYGCSSLQDVYLLRQTPPTVSSLSFDNCHSDLKFHLTCEQIAHYSTANIWSQYYTSRFAPIMDLPTGVSAQVASDCQDMGSASVNTGVDICNGAYLSATANTNYHFVKWSTATNDNFSTSATLSVNDVTENTTYTAHFALNTYTLTLAHLVLSDNGQNNNWGILSASGTGVTYSGTDANGNLSYTVLHGATPTLSATAATGFVSHGWNLDGGGHSNETSITIPAMSADATYTALFQRESYTLTVAHADGQDDNWGTISVSGSGVTGSNGATYTVINHRTPTITATARPGYEFVRWTDADGNEVSTDASFTISDMNADATYTAHFGIASYTLTVGCATGQDNWGTLSVSVNGTTLTPNQDGTYTVLHGTHVTLTATAAQDYEFVRWTDADGNQVSENATYTINAMSSNTSYSAHFATPYYTLTVGHATGQDNSWGTISASGTGVTQNQDGTYTVRRRANVNIALNPNNANGKYYIAKRVSYNGDTQEISAENAEDGSSQNLSFQMPDEDVTCTGEFEYVFTIENGALTACKDWANGPYEIPASVTSIGYQAFWNRDSITAITFAEGSQLATIGEEAFNRSGITSITIPASVTSIGSEAFQSCNNLGSITFGENSQLATIGNSAFRSCGVHDNHLLTSINIPATVTSIGADAFRSDNYLSTITFGENSQLTSIGARAFYQCGIRWRDGYLLTAITIPASVTSIGDSAFRLCDYLQDVTLQPATPPALGSFAFQRCHNDLRFHLSCAQYSNYATADNWSEFSSRFSTDRFPNGASVQVAPGCSLKGTVSVDCATATATATANQTFTFTGWYVEGSETPVSTNATLSASQMTANTAYYASFVGAPHTLTVVVNNAPQSANWGGISGGSSSFVVRHGDVARVSIEFNENGTLNGADYNFKKYYKVMRYQRSDSETPYDPGYTDPNNEYQFTMPDQDVTVTVDLEYVFTIVDSTDENNNATRTLTECKVWASGDLVIPDGVVSIGENAFNGHNISSITIPASVTSIDNNAFYGCIPLERVNLLPATPPSLGNTVFDECSYNIHFYIPCTNRDNYNVWSNYRIRISNPDGSVEDEGLPLMDRVLPFVEVQGAVASACQGMGTVSVYDQISDCSDVVLSATANTGYHFLFWNDGNTYDDRRADETPATGTLTAYFEPDNFYLYAHVADDQQTMGRVSGSGTYPFGTEAILTAEAFEGYLFERWSDGSTLNPRTVTIGLENDYTAFFREAAGTVASDIRIVSQGSSLVIYGGEGQQLRLYDMQGRLITRQTIAATPFEMHDLATGVYMVQVGSYPAQKVVVVK